MILNLVLTHKWYDMIERGIKKEEYREITPYWSNRLVNRYGIEYWESVLSHNTVEKMAETYNGVPRMIFNYGYADYDAVCFHRGYTNTTITFEYNELTIGKGKPELGAPDKPTFIIKLGKRLSK